MGGDRTEQGRIAPGVWFPVVVFAGWRIVHLAVVAVLGGDIVRSAFLLDGGNYRAIMERGYSVPPGVPRPYTAFFPLTPWLARAPGLVMSTTAAAVLTANVLALLAFVAVWAVAREWKDDGIARITVLLLALWPASVFLWMFYAEAAFIAASAGAVWADRRGRHGAAAALLFAAALARTTGILVAVVLVGVRIWRRRRVDGPAVGYLVSAALPVAWVMVLQHRAVGDALAFTRQRPWGRWWAPPWVALRGGVGSVLHGSTPVARALDLVGVVVMGLAVAWALWWRARGRGGRGALPIEAPLLTAVLIGLPLCTRLLTSANRWVLAAWPGAVIVAMWLALRPRVVRGLVYGVLALASIGLLRELVDGRFIG